jgi:hypothetical protein
MFMVVGVIRPAFVAAITRAHPRYSRVAGRLSVRREAGEHLFHGLLHVDFTTTLGRGLTEKSRAASALTGALLRISF